MKKNCMCDKLFCINSTRVTALKTVLFCEAMVCQNQIVIISVQLALNSITIPTIPLCLLPVHWWLREKWSNRRKRAHTEYQIIYIVQLFNTNNVSD